MDSSAMRFRWTSTLLTILPFVPPLYLIRFQIAFLPTTVLELYIGILFGTFLFEGRSQAIINGWKNLGHFRFPLIAWLITTLIAIFISPSLITGLGLWRAYILEPALIFFILCSVRAFSPSQTELSPASRLLANRITHSLFLVTLIVTGWAVIQFVTGRGIPHPWDVSIAAGRRATGPFPYPNALALFVVPIGALALTKLSSLRSILPFVTVIAAFLACLLARSDGGLIALSAATWLTLFFSPPFSIPNTRYTIPIRKILIAVTTLILLLIALIPKLHQPILHELTFQNWSGKVRMYMWRDTRAMLKDHWFFGAGFGGYPTVFKSYQRTTGIEVFQYPHNIVLNVWSETGLPGLLAFASILLIWVYSVFRRSSSVYAIPDSRYPILLLPLLVILIHGLIDVPYFKNDLAIVFWLLIWITTQSSTPSVPLSPAPAGSPSTTRV
ncbi:O-antigen ligase family protein [Patescibacteria group bacterium]|nr:O-antigen ligase family protein [Patescibacteria group bacterium]